MKHAKILMFALCIASLAGCVREKLTDCYTTLIFSYTGDGNSEIFGEKISGVDLYVFDSNHKVLTGFMPYRLTPAEIAARRARLLLPTGQTYNLVAIGNPEYSELHSLTEGTVDSTKIVHPGHEVIGNGVNVIDTHPHLYLGRELASIPDEAGSTHTIDFDSSHIDMVVEVVGYTGSGLATAGSGATRPGNVGLTLEHSNLPGWTSFSGNCVCPKGDVVSHFPSSINGTVGKAGEAGASDISTFAYQIMRDIRGGKTSQGSFIHLYDGNDRIFTLDVEQFVRDHLMPNAAVPGPYNGADELISEAFIPIRIEFGAVGVEVTIPDWALNNTHPEF